VIETTSTVVSPWRNASSSSSSLGEYSIGLYGQLAALGSEGSSSFILQKYVDEDIAWREVAYVDRTSLENKETNSSVSTDVNSLSFAQAVSLSSSHVIVSKVVNSPIYTDECDEDTCQSDWYGVECCSQLDTSCSLRVMVYSYDSNGYEESSESSSMSVEATQELFLPLISTSSSSSNGTEVLSVLSVDNIELEFSDTSSFYASVTWSQLNSSAIGDEGGDISSHSQIFFASVSSLSDSFEWEDAMGSTHLQNEDMMMTEVSVYGQHVIQGFWNYSKYDISEGVVMCYLSGVRQQALHPYCSRDDGDEANGDDTTGCAYAYFGSSVTVHVDNLAVGAYGLESVFVYSLDDSRWSLHSVLMASDSSNGALFGYSVKFLNDNQLAIGSPLGYDSGGSGEQSGAVYKFGHLADLNKWVEISKSGAMNASSGSCFGSSILAAEEALFVVGAQPGSVVARVGSSVMPSQDKDVSSYDDDDDGSTSSGLPFGHVYSLSFSDCETFVKCTEALYNATTNVTTEAVCTTYSTCSSGGSQNQSGISDANRVLYFVIFVGAALLTLPAIVLGVSLVQRRLHRSRGEFLEDDSNDNDRAANVLRMTPLNTLEEGNPKATLGPSGTVGESPVGRPPLDGAVKKGRGRNSYSALTSQVQVEPNSPPPNQNATTDPPASSSTSTVGGLLSKLRSMSTTAPPAATTDEKKNSEVDINDINSPGGPPRLPIQKKSPFTMPAVEE
jgi:hypothetical protein